MSEKRIFETFYWISPEIINGNLQANINWTFPENDPSSKVFNDISDFCFPDIKVVEPELPGDFKQDNFIFTLTDNFGDRFYGICFRSLFKGRKNRFDVGKRYKHCLCLVTKYLFFSFFKSLLLEIFSISLLENNNKSAIQILQSIYFNNFSMGQNFKIELSRQTIPKLSHDINFFVPNLYSSNLDDEVKILPILEILGVDNFIKLLSSILNESRIIILADDIETLSSSLLASLTLISPFKWHHIFIPILPTKLISYVSAPMPYIIGIKKFLLPEVLKQPLEQVIIVDMDVGDIQTHSGAVVHDIIGDSLKKFKQASESFDRVKAKAAVMANRLRGKHVEGSEVSSKDLMYTIHSELRSVIYKRPGGPSLQSKATEIIRGLPGQFKSIDESKAKWNAESERTVREQLTLFFVYLFFELDLFFKSGEVSSSEKNNLAKSEVSSIFKIGNNLDFRSKFDIYEFLEKKKRNGDSSQIIDFLKQFMHTQMFERYCFERYEELSRIKTLKGQNNIYDTNNDNVSIFSEVSKELFAKNIPISVSSVKSIVLSKSRDQIFDNDMALNNEELDESKFAKSEFHHETLMLTAVKRVKNNQISTEFPLAQDIRNSLSDYESAVLGDGLLRKIIESLTRSDLFLKITKTISMRLRNCLVSLNRSGVRIPAIKALILLREILLKGPEYILGYSIGLIRVFIFIIRFNIPHNKNHHNYPSYLEVKRQAKNVLSIVIDRIHYKLLRTQEDLRILGPLKYFKFGKFNSIEKMNNQNRKKTISAPKMERISLEILPNSLFKIPKLTKLHEELNLIGLKNISPLSIESIVPKISKFNRTKEDNEDDEVEEKISLNTNGCKAIDDNFNSIDPFLDPFGYEDKKTEARRKSENLISFDDIDPKNKKQSFTTHSSNFDSFIFPVNNNFNDFFENREVEFEDPFSGSFSDPFSSNTSFVDPFQNNNTGLSISKANVAQNQTSVDFVPSFSANYHQPTSQWYRSNPPFVSNNPLSEPASFRGSIASIPSQFSSRINFQVREKKSYENEDPFSDLFNLK